MKKYICDFCKAEVNDYAHWSKGEPRTMYELRTIHEVDDSPYEGVILCQHCVEYLLSHPLGCIESRK